MTIPELYEIFRVHPSIVTDTRKIKDGDIFFALKGPNFNGNEFAVQALEKGAAYVVCDELCGEPNDNVIQVADSLLALQQLALHHRMQFTIPFIAITGSNGKTTTKELVTAVLKTTFRTYTTVGNFNNHIGIPLTILSVAPDAEIAIIEMGANHQQEIAGYCRYTLPTHGVITNCGKAHLEGFGGEAGVRKGKGELFDFLKQHKGTAFINTDLIYLSEMSAGISQVIKFGEQEGDFIGKVIDDSHFVEVTILKGAHIPSIKTNLVGAYNLNNILTAVCIGKTFGVSDSDIKEALEAYMPTNSRSQLVQKDGNEIILDAYNANPSSMKLAIENFANMQGENKVVMLGAMMELGEFTAHEHHQIVELLMKFKWVHVVLVGEAFQNLPKHYLHFNYVAEAKQWLKEQQFTNVQMLIKGSRSTQMEKLLD